MSALTFKTARDAIQATFNAAWVSLSPAAVSSTTPVRVEWDGVDDGTARDQTKPYASVWVRHKAGFQATLRNAEGVRRFRRTGMVTVQIFEPLLIRSGLSVVENLAIIARDAFEGVSTADGIWFQNVTAKEIGSDQKGWYQINVTAAFEYDELK